MDPKCSTNQSVVVLDPFHRSVYILSFVCFFFFYVCSRSLFIYLFIYIYYFVFLVYHFVSLSVYRGCWRMYVVPVMASTQRVMAWHCTTYYCCLHRCCLCRSFVTTELVSLGRRISGDTGCAGYRRVERTV